MTQPIVKLNHIQKTFSNGTIALEDVNLAIEAGEFVSLLGPSGCGKSTALRIIADLSSPTAGRVEWGASTGKDIGFVFQEPTLMPWATVYNNVYLPLRLSGMGKSQASVAISEALETVGLSDFRDAYPRELSGGMKMRVSIARALVTKPKLLLMDEPFAALDEITRTKLNNDLLALWRQFGLTVIFVTHSVFESVYLSTRIVVMAARPGRIIENIPVAGPDVRDLSFRTSDVYGACCAQASQALSNAMDQADLL